MNPANKAANRIKYVAFSNKVVYKGQVLGKCCQSKVSLIPIITILKVLKEPEILSLIRHRKLQYHGISDSTWCHVKQWCIRELLYKHRHILYDFSNSIRLTQNQTIPTQLFYCLTQIIVLNYLKKECGYDQNSLKLWADYSL